MANKPAVTPRGAYLPVLSVLPDPNGPEPNGVRRMWEGGPLRQFSKTQVKSHYVGYSGPFLKGYAGSYVCDLCLLPSAGVYFLRPQRSWLCGKCKRKVQRSRKGSRV